jgi:hypothetical protein
MTRARPVPRRWHTRQQSVLFAEYTPPGAIPLCPAALSLAIQVPVPTDLTQDRHPEAARAAGCELEAC